MHKSQYSQIIIMLLLIISPIQSQVGIKGGVAVSDIIFDIEGQNPYLGYGTNSLSHRLPYLTYEIGILKSYSINDRIDFQPELLISRKGLNYSKAFIYDDIKYYLKIHYLEVPLLIKYKLQRGPKNRLALLFGPYISYSISNKHFLSLDNQSEEKSIRNMKKFDYGIAASIAHYFNVQQSQFVVDFRSTYGLMDMMNPLDGYIKEYYGPDEGRARNVNISLTLGYILKVGDK